MTADQRSILVCDDNIDHLMLIKRELERFSPSFLVTTVTTAQVCRQEMAQKAYDVVIIDYLLRDLNGIELLREMTRQHPGLAVIMITGMGNEEIAVQAMKAGASDYVIKSSGSFAVVPLVVMRALERQALLESKRALEIRVARSSQLSLLGAVALGAAHDLNNLLGAILGRAQMMRGAVDAGVSRQLDVIETAARDSVAIVRRILDFTGKRAPGQRETVPVAGAVSDCLEFTRPRWEADAQRRGVVYQIAAEVPDTMAVAAQPAAVREVLTNLIINALEAMPEGGMLLVRAREEEQEAHLCVQDTGEGMSRAQLDRLFDPCRGSDKTGGHGVGLATCRALLEEMGGRIQVQSEPGVGTMCEVVLPLAPGGAEDATPTAAGTDAAIAAAPRGLRVLVVDDEPTVAQLLAEVLTTDGQRVTVAFGSEEAMSEFEPGGYDLLFCDLSLPGMSGLEVARAARARDPAVAIILVTGWGGETIAGESAPAGVDLTAYKPLDVARIRSLCAQGAGLAAARRAAPSAP